MPLFKPHSMGSLIISMIIKYRHNSDDDSKDDETCSYEKNGYADLHPMGEIPVSRWQMPVKGNHADIQPVQHDTEDRPTRRPLDKILVLLPHTNGIEKTGQGDES